MSLGDKEEQRGKFGRTRKYRRLGTEKEYNTHMKYRTARVREKIREESLKKNRECYLGLGIE